MGLDSRKSDIEVSKEAKIRNQYNQVPHPTQDTTWESDKTQQNTTHMGAKRLVIPFPAGDHKAAKNRQDSTTDTKH